MAPWQQLAQRRSNRERPSYLCLPNALHQCDPDSSLDIPCKGTNTNTLNNAVSCLRLKIRVAVITPRTNTVSICSENTLCLSGTSAQSPTMACNKTNAPAQENWMLSYLECAPSVAMDEERNQSKKSDDEAVPKVRNVSTPPTLSRISR